MKFLSDKKIALLRDGDLVTFVDLDDHGFILGADESIKDFINRLTELRKNIADFNDDLKGAGDEEPFLFYDVPLIKKDEIPKSVYKSCKKTCQDLYGFSIDWVPGFYTNHNMGILFAGCAMYSYKDFFAVFIIRKSFQKSEKWGLYSRTELMAHELTHIAHIGFKTLNYEEVFAYQTSTSLFRRVVGGMFRTPKDTYLIVGSMLVLLLCQIVNMSIRPPEAVWDQPMPLLFLLAFCSVFTVLGRYTMNLHRYKKAMDKLRSMFTNPGAVLFRCSEEEIETIASIKHLKPFIDAQTDTRWKIIKNKFQNPKNPAR
ncbi:MAG: hypothetical protein HRT89_16775 [Lentisphaeria bacterium]|nr:hypothetical protein [Lentisphaeria bacterium]NQZ69715.1 hypothetical protein [Lentisphaeria bacterium]